MEPTSLESRAMSKKNWVFMAVRRVFSMMGNA
jgi:hypothetical protein